MPMNRVNPDLVTKLQNYMASGMSMFGQAVTLRKYISASAGVPEMSIADKLMYQSRPIQMELRMLTIEEAQMVGGQDIRGTFEFMSIDPISQRDEVIYRDETYRVLSVPERETIGETIYFKGLIQRASITGFYA